MNPLAVITLAFTGAVVGSLLNLAIYRLRIHPLPYSPWWPLSDAEREALQPKSRKGKKRPNKRTPQEPLPRRWWTDCVPIFGWLSLRREEPWLGRGFWVRPMLIEIGTAATFVFLAWWEVEQLQLIEAQAAFINGLLPAGARPLPLPAYPVWTVFASHALLISLMIAATWIDIDELIIPDAVTVTGTLAALLIAATWPGSHLPLVYLPMNAVGLISEPLHLASSDEPNNWPAVLNGRWGLLLGLACLWMWCFALLPRVWRGRRGVRTAAVMLLARMRRERATYLILAMGVMVSLVVAAVWLWARPDSWQGLLTSLVGLAVGGGMIWVVRLVGAGILRREAMGFGDVTLMAMIGAFLGWQPCLMTFFIGPFFGLLPGLAVLLSRGRWHIEIPYGPFLCLGATTVILCWGPLWVWFLPLLAVPNLVPIVLLIMVPMLAAALILLQIIKRIFGGAEEEPAAD